MNNECKNYSSYCYGADPWDNNNSPRANGIMRDAVEALAKRKFGDGGVYNPNTPGAWSDSPKVRSNAAPYTEEFKRCVALQAQYIYDTYGKVSRDYSKHILFYVRSGSAFRLGLL